MSDAAAITAPPSAQEESATYEQGGILAADAVPAALISMRDIWKT